MADLSKLQGIMSAVGRAFAPPAPVLQRLITQLIFCCGSVLGTTSRAGSWLSGMRDAHRKLSRREDAVDRDLEKQVLW